ncbi:MAG: hypothetical protein OXS30_03850 [Chloroflexota bacterium]|nr:hypothetical protein [Chloroflexota bacterium]MDE2987827.1 hypothetical protein [Chloroflexota bacterium]
MLRTLTLSVAFIAAVLLGGVAMAAGGEGGGLHAGQIVAIVIGIALSAILLGLSAAYILPKPPKF